MVELPSHLDFLLAVTFADDTHDLPHRWGFRALPFYP